MALFRRLARLPQLKDFSTPGKGLLFLTPVERTTLQGSKRTLGCSVSTGFLRQRLASADLVFLTSTTSVLCTPCRGLYTQSGGGLAASANEKQPKSGSTSPKSQQHEHGSVLQELMKVKEEEQPKQLTVGAKGMQQVLADALVLHLLPYPSLPLSPPPSPPPSSRITQLYKLVETSRTS